MVEGRVRSAMVTGAGSGIGRATAHILASQGVAVTLADIDPETVRAVCEEIIESGGRALPVQCDVADPAACRAAVRSAREFGGDLDILVNAAGMIVRASVVDTDEEIWRRTLAVNLGSVFFMSKYALEQMAHGSSIVNVASGWGLVGGPRAAAYCAAKAGVVNLTRAMAIDHGPSGVRVNCVCPGNTDTPMLRSEAAQLGIDFTAFQVAAARVPVGRVGVPRDIAGAIAWLVSESAAFVTGAVVVVDGGGLAGW